MQLWNSWIVNGFVSTSDSVSSLLQRNVAKMGTPPVYLILQTNGSAERVSQESAATDRRFALHPITPIASTMVLLVVRPTPCRNGDRDESEGEHHLTERGTCGGPGAKILAQLSKYVVILHGLTC